MTILILAPPTDEHAKAVSAALASDDIDHVVADLGDFPQHGQVVSQFSCCSDCGTDTLMLRVGGRELDLTTCQSVWWRRPQHPAISDAITRPSHRQFAANETYEALSGLWHCIDAFWINDPTRDLVAHRKSYQLTVARSAGMTIPRTLITNDVGEARKFIDALGYRDVVYKAFSATVDEWRETRVLQPEEFELLDNVAYAPVIFQEYIDAIYDLRVTIVGREIFAAAIYSQQTEYKIDCRMDIANARIEPVDLPDVVRAQLLALMDHLGLVYGAIDLRYTPEGAYVFLEINPAGQYLFIEDATEQPITAVLATALRSQDLARPG